MPKDRRSFFERLTGAVPQDQYLEDEQVSSREEPRAHLAANSTRPRLHKSPANTKEANWLENTEEEGQLTVDVFQTDNEIIIQSTVAGVRPDDLDVQITRDMVTIRGKREQHREVEKENYFYQELYWGTFSRSILLPQEVDVDDAEASLKQGLLTVRLPKTDRNRTERLRVKSES
ncbi:MAG: Hsp20/alpha crystallin family protein [Candidatus Ryanbacteria bacterium]|nr:Hsp20/alpha crystallin family protein [Candidatus Ryanbacteria bacterium]